MIFRKATKEDTESVMDIIRQAQGYFACHGINQWQNNYPNTDIINNDIEKGYGYVLLKDNMIIGTVAVVFDGDKNYEYIEGKWLSNGDYAAIHRIAVDAGHKGTGAASVIIKNIEDMCLKRGVKSIKVDTHEKNLPMQKLLLKNKFVYCGTIYLEDGSKRMAFEKLLG